MPKPTLALSMTILVNSFTLEVSLSLLPILNEAFYLQLFVILLKMSPSDFVSFRSDRSRCRVSTMIFADFGLEGVSQRLLLRTVLYIY